MLARNVGADFSGVKIVNAGSCVPNAASNWIPRGKRSLRETRCESEKDDCGELQKKSLLISDL